MGDCLYVEQLLEDAGSRPAAVEVQEGLAPQVSVGRAEDELDGIDPGLRPVLLLPARAELRSLAARLPDVDTADWAVQANGDRGETCRRVWVNCWKRRSGWHGICRSACRGSGSSGSAGRQRRCGRIYGPGRVWRRPPVTRCAPSQCHRVTTSASALALLAVDRVAGLTVPQRAADADPDPRMTRISVLLGAVGDVMTGEPSAMEVPEVRDAMARTGQGRLDDPDRRRIHAVRRSPRSAACRSPRSVSHPPSSLITSGWPYIVSACRATRMRSCPRRGDCLPASRSVSSTSSPPGRCDRTVVVEVQ